MTGVLLSGRAEHDFCRAIWGNRQA